MDTSKQIFVSGRVQGVFFRDTTRQVAEKLKLSGGVRNLYDGRVEVVVTGDESAIESLIKWLEIGPKYAKVTTIEVIDLAALEQAGVQHGHFEIWPTR